MEPPADDREPAASRAPTAAGAGTRFSPMPADEALLLFDATGRPLAATRDAPPFASLADLEAAFVQPDGLPIRLDRGGRRVGIPADGSSGRVLLVGHVLDAGSLPEESPTGDAAVIAVGLLPFLSEDDPETVQRALGSVLAHELRTPLTTILAGAELAAAPGIREETRVEAIRAVAREAQQLQRIIEDLVALVRWAVDPLPELEPVLLPRVLADVLDDRARYTDQPRIAVHADRVLPPVVGSELILEHLVRNLVEHAAANTSGAGEVVVEARQADDRIELRVRDDGPARDEPGRATAFDLFARTTRSGADASGANLAMVVARRLASRIGASLTVGAPQRGGESVLALTIASGEEPEARL